MKFHFILARRQPDVPSRIILDVSRILRERGHRVNSSIPEEELCGLHDLPVDHDVYLLKSYTELSLSLAGALSAQGANLINPYDGCAAARNKIVCYQMLKKACVPVPNAWITSDLRSLAPLLGQHALILKPVMGWRGEGIRVVRDEKELAAIPKVDGPLLIQEYIENPGEDLRLYVAGEEVFGIRKRFSHTSFAVDGEPVPVSREMRSIARLCGRIFGLQLYGIDVIENGAGPRVVDVNYFPGYKGVPGAAHAVAEHIEHYAAAIKHPAKRERIRSGAAR
jgi:glutathione synthase/RimK-type ligase-like ATP-grasp enzyme